MLVFATIDKNCTRCFEPTQNNFENTFWYERKLFLYVLELR